MEKSTKIDSQASNCQTKVKKSRNVKNEVLKSSDSFSTSRYGRARRPRITSDYYCSDEALSPLLNPPDKKITIYHLNECSSQDSKDYINGTNRLDTSDLPESDENEFEFDNLLKIVSRPSFMETPISPPSPLKVSTLKTYCNRKKRLSNECSKSFAADMVSNLDSFSWTENIKSPDEDSSVNHTENMLKSIKRNLSFNNESNTESGLSNIVQTILMEFSDTPELTENDNVSSTEQLIQSEHCQSNYIQAAEFKNQDTCTNVIKEEVQSPVVDSSTQIKTEPGESLQQTEWNVGDLIWTRVGHHPLWPSMIDIDPYMNTHIRVRSLSKHGKPIMRIHVRFFGDCGRRSWVAAKTSLKFNGKAEFDEWVVSLTSPKHKFKTMYDAGLFIKPKQLPLWLSAVSEAESLMSKTVKDRLKFFQEIISNRAKQNKELKNKELNFSSNSQDSSVDSVQDKEIKTEILSDSELNKTFPKTSTPKLIKAKKKLMKAYPIRERKQVERYSYSNQSKIQLLPSPAKEKLKTDKDDISTIKYRESVTPSPLLVVPTLSNTARHKKNNIFKGVTKDRLCQSCERLGQVFKCRGSCQRYYHLACAKAQNKITDLTDSDAENELNSEDLKLTRKSVTLSIAEQIDAKMAEVMKQLGDKIIYTETSADDSSNESDNNSSLDTKGANHVTGDITPPNKVLDLAAEFKCDDCLNNRLPSCFVCGLYDTNNPSDVRQKCSLFQCGRAYHPRCLKTWPQTQWITTTSKENITTETLICPYHVCHMCVSDDPRGLKARFNNDKLAKCIRCPTTYHTSSFCVPAGSEILSYNQIVCPKHIILKQLSKRKSSQHVNANWCFICSIGGSLICCETCPTSFHVECLKISPPEGSYICEECETGRLPLYDEIVWVKLGLFRWWPAQILFPNEIPNNILALPHHSGEFVVRFFGSHDYYWINRGRVFLYQDGDSGIQSSRKSNVDGLFKKAVEEAAIAFKAVQTDRENRLAEAKPSMKPPPYIRIKTNRPVGNVRVAESHTNSLTPCDCDPKTSEPCGPDSNCLNRLLLTECNPTVCPAGTKCNNQQFEKREYPQLIPYKTTSRGWGLKTLESIKKGQFVIEYVGEMINEAEYQKRVQRMSEQKDENYYFLTIDKDRMLDAGPKGNVARFMNHSCQPNCETQKWTVNGNTRVGLFALDDIAADTELTFNYNLECIGKEKKICKCGAPQCSGFIGVKVKQNDRRKIQVNKNGKRKYLNTKLSKNSKRICFACGESNSEGKCRSKLCSKAYHLACVQLTEWPRENWWCPRHKCSLCNRTLRLKWCQKCPRSFCPKHVEDTVRLLNSKEIICSQHIKEETVETNVKDSTDETENSKKLTKPKRFNLSLKKRDTSTSDINNSESLITDMNISTNIADVSLISNQLEISAQSESSNTNRKHTNSDSTQAKSKKENTELKRKNLKKQSRAMTKKNSPGSKIKNKRGSIKLNSRDSVLTPTTSNKKRISKLNQISVKNQSSNKCLKTNFGLIYKLKKFKKNLIDDFCAKTPIKTSIKKRGRKKKLVLDQQVGNSSLKRKIFEDINENQPLKNISHSNNSDKIANLSTKNILEPKKKISEKKNFAILTSDKINPNETNKEQFKTIDINSPTSDRIITSENKITDEIDIEESSKIAKNSTVDDYVELKKKISNKKNCDNTNIITNDIITSNGIDIEESKMIDTNSLTDYNLESKKKISKKKSRDSVMNNTLNSNGIDFEEPKIIGDILTDNNVEPTKKISGKKSRDSIRNDINGIRSKMIDINLPKTNDVEPKKKNFKKNRDSVTNITITNIEESKKIDTDVSIDNTIELKKKITEKKNRDSITNDAIINSNGIDINGTKLTDTNLPADNNVEIKKKFCKKKNRDSVTNNTITLNGIDFEKQKIINSNFPTDNNVELKKKISEKKNRDLVMNTISDEIDIKESKKIDKNSLTDNNVESKKKISNSKNHDSLTNGLVTTNETVIEQYKMINTNSQTDNYVEPYIIISKESENKLPVDDVNISKDNVMIEPTKKDIDETSQESNDIINSNELNVSDRIEKLEKIANNPIIESTNNNSVPERRKRGRPKNDTRKSSESQLKLTDCNVEENLETTTKNTISNSSNNNSIPKGRPRGRPRKIKTVINKQSIDQIDKVNQLKINNIKMNGIILSKKRPADNALVNPIAKKKCLTPDIHIPKRVLRNSTKLTVTNCDNKSTTLSNTTNGDNNTSSLTSLISDLERKENQPQCTVVINRDECNLSVRKKTSGACGLVFDTIPVDSS